MNDKFDCSYGQSLQLLFSGSESVTVRGQLAVDCKPVEEYIDVLLKIAQLQDLQKHISKNQSNQEQYFEAYGGDYEATSIATYTTSPRANHHAVLIISTRLRGYATDCKITLFRERYNQETMFSTTLYRDKLQSFLDYLKNFLQGR